MVRTKYCKNKSYKYCNRVIFKAVATRKNISMSELLIVCTENFIEKEKLKSLEYEITKSRTEEFELKLQLLKSRMEEKKLLVFKLVKMKAVNIGLVY